MDFRYDNMGKITKSTIKAGQKWDSKNNNNEHFNNIFKDLDNGDNVVSELELDTYNRIFKSRDYDKDGKLHYYEASKTYTKEELQQLKSNVKIAGDIYKDINKKNFIFPTTGKDFVNQYVKNNNLIIVARVNETLSKYNNQDNSVVINPKHAYSVLRANDKYVYLADPVKTSEEIKLTREEFLQAFNHAGVYKHKSFYE